MYAVAVERSFVAQHFLTVPDPGPEGDLHSHHYTVETAFRGSDLDEYGYLVDIDDATDAIDATVDTFRDETLNDLGPFEGLNPSVEHLARVFGDRLLGRLEPSPADELRVAIREDDAARVSHRRPL